MKPAPFIAVAFVVAMLASFVAALDVRAEKLSVDQTDSTIVVQAGERPLLTYNKVSPPVPQDLKDVYERSGCLHPVCSPSGQSVTAMFAQDHPHQQGIFAAWVRTTYEGETIDFWNLGGGTGRVLHEKVVSIFQEDDRAGFEVDLIHRKETEPNVDVLRERWKVTAYPTDGSYHVFDLESTQAAITSKPLLVNEYHYGGFAVRGPARWVTNGKDNTKRDPSGFLNSLGSKRTEGNHQHAKWVSLWGETEGKPVSITVLCHSTNFRAPQTARIHPTKPYFCFAPCVDGQFVIDGEHPYQARYRYLITDAMPDAKWLDEQWKAWASETTKASR